jgi:hypothetical protein
MATNHVNFVYQSRSDSFISLHIVVSPIRRRITVATLVYRGIVPSFIYGCACIAVHTSQLSTQLTL